METHSRTDTSVPSVSLVIPCRNEIDYIEQCLRSVLAQERPVSSAPYDIIVADGMSDDGSREVIARIAAEHPEIRLIDNPAGIQAVALNLAVRAARGEIIVRMDAHTEYAPDYVRENVRILLETGAECVGGPARTKAHGYKAEAIRLAYHSHFAVGPIKFHDENYEGYADTVAYGCWRKSLLIELGLWDEEMARAEDHELAMRLTRRGGRIWLSHRIKSWYYPRQSIGELFRQYFQYGYWKLKVMRKYRIPGSLRHLAPIGFLAALILTGISAIFSDAGAKLFLLVIGSYAALLGIGTIFTCAGRERARYAPIMPLIFAVYHFSYGLGSLLGLWDFFVIKRPPRSALSGLSRVGKGGSFSGRRVHNEKSPDKG